VPFIDVATEVVLDPVVALTRFNVVRRRTWTDVHGFEQNQPIVIRNVVGSVTPTGDNSVNRDSDYQSQMRTLLVITRFLLRASEEDQDRVQWQPDLVQFDDGFYLVKSVDGFGNFGTGFVAATCESFDYEIHGTMPNPPRYGADDYKSGVYTTILGALPW